MHLVLIYGPPGVGKLSSVQRLRDDMTRQELFEPLPNRESLHIDNTHLPPDEVARLIVAHYPLTKG